jgi:hypothetical protein
MGYVLLHLECVPTLLAEASAFQAHQEAILFLRLPNSGLLPSGCSSEPNLALYVARTLPRTLFVA